MSSAVESVAAARGVLAHAGLEHHGVDRVVQVQLEHVVEHGLRVRHEQVVVVRGGRVGLRRGGQQLPVRRRLVQHGVKVLVDEVDLVRLAGAVEVFELLGDLERLGHGGRVAQLGEDLPHGQVGAREHVAPPAAAHDHGAGARLGAHEPLEVAQQQLVIRSAQPAVAPEDHVAHAADVPPGREIRVLKARVAGEQGVEHGLTLVREQAHARKARLRPAQLRHGDHLHRAGDLLRAIHAADARADLMQVRQGASLLSAGGGNGGS